MCTVHGETTVQEDVEAEDNHGLLATASSAARQRVRSRFFIDRFTRSRDCDIARGIPAQ